MKDLYTNRLKLRLLQITDAPFIYDLVTDPDWLTHIGDKGVRNIDDAKNYIINGPQAMYQQHGVGSLVVETLDNNMPVGMCGLLQRDNLNMPDLGFAFLPDARGKGYAAEAAKAVIDNAFNQCNIECLAAITAQDNQASMLLLQKLGFILVGTHLMNPEGLGSNLFELTKTAWAK
ncbi:GNAT family N-acetyltransferase [Paraglaciecola sp.]|uniref:GNAT family N-acetyltransferase n=1 Tax=Paraglaciecola sp. TaxID=1920173 RepID=UPI0030F45001